jgi:hypothetical protein
MVGERVVAVSVGGLAFKQEDAGHDPEPVLKGTLTTDRAIGLVARALAYLQVAASTMLAREEPEPGWRQLTTQRFGSLSRSLMTLMTPRTMDSKQIREPWKWQRRAGDPEPRLQTVLREQYRLACEQAERTTPDRAVRLAFLATMRACWPAVRKMAPRSRKRRLLKTKALRNGFARIVDSIVILYPESDLAGLIQPKPKRRKRQLPDTNWSSGTTVSPKP